MNFSSAVSRRIALTLLPVVSLQMLSSQGRSQDLPPPNNTNAILRELDQVASGSKNRFLSRLSGAISQIQSASGTGSSALDFYLRALENTKYLEKHQDFQEWQKRHQDDLRDVSLQNAAQLQLRYLLLALQRTQQQNPYAQIPQCLAYLNALSGENFLVTPAPSEPAPEGRRNGRMTKAPPPLNQPVEEARNLIRQPLKNAPAVEWMQIADLLPDDSEFEPSPGNYQRIMEKNIRVPLRARRDQQLFRTWDMQIAAESSSVTATGSQQQADDFNRQRLPELLFQKAQDTAAVGQPNRALGEVMQLIQSYSDHPSVKDWVDNARELLTNPTALIAPMATNSSLGTTTAVSNGPPVQTNAPTPPSGS